MGEVTCQTSGRGLILVFLVALFASDDAYHASALEFLKNAADIEFHLIWPVVTEAAFFLNNTGKVAMLEWLARKPIVFHEIRVADLPAIRVVIEKYHNLSPDFTDAALVALADQYSIDSIVTVDVRDFSVYRLASGRSFTRLWR